MSKDPKIDRSAPDDETVISPIESLVDDSKESVHALVVISGALLGRTYTLKQNEFMIGRIDTCDLSVDEDLVSRQHCKIVISPQGAEIFDLQSTNGTLVNGRRVERAMLQEGDQIQIGASTILKYDNHLELEQNFLNELFKAATKDFLTGAYNKKYFLDRLQNEFSYTHRHGGDLSILVIDLDHFKRVNDTFGHLAGDVTLQKVAHHLISHTRKDDTIARFGGEEFVILMRDCDREQAKQLAENLRSGISALKIVADGKPVSVTVSIGVASLSDLTKNRLVRFELLLAEADANLYTAKNQGRNRVCAS